MENRSLHLTPWKPPVHFLGSIQPQTVELCSEQPSQNRSIPAFVTWFNIWFNRFNDSFSTNNSGQFLNSWYAY
jgi:hypothetical protein